MAAWWSQIPFSKTNLPAMKQLWKLDVYGERAIDVYIECRNSKTTPKSQIDVYFDTVDSTLAVYVEFLKINTFYGI